MKITGAICYRPRIQMIIWLILFVLVITGYHLMYNNSVNFSTWYRTYGITRMFQDVPKMTLVIRTTSTPKLLHFLFCTALRTTAIYWSPYFGNITLILNKGSPKDHKLAMRIAKYQKAIGHKFNFVYENITIKGFNEQVYSTFLMDQYFDTPVIVYTDTDAKFKAPVTLDNIFAGKKLKAKGVHTFWRDWGYFDQWRMTLKQLLGFPMVTDSMCYFPVYWWKDTITNCRNYIIKHTIIIWLLHIQGAAALKWYTNQFPLFLARFHENFLAKNSNASVEDIEQKAATSEEVIIPPTESSSYASLPPMSPIHSSTPVKNVSSGNQDYGTLSRVAELEKKVNSLQEQIGTLVKQIKDLTMTETTKPEPKPNTNINTPPLLKTPDVKPVNNPTTGNKILIIGSSILGRVKNQYLKENVQVESIKGATLPVIFNALSGLHLPQFSDIIIQVGGNDVNQRRPFADIEYDIVNIRDYIRGASEHTKVHFSEVTPRFNADTRQINSLYRRLAPKIGFFLIALNREFTRNLSLFWKDRIHLSDNGTAELIRHYNEYVTILPDTQSGKSDCFNCGERGHNWKTCAHRHTVTCWKCGVYGHKENSCNYRPSYDYGFNY